MRDSGDESAFGPLSRGFLGDVTMSHLARDPPPETIPCRLG